MYNRIVYPLFHLSRFYGSYNRNSFCSYFGAITHLCSFHELYLHRFFSWGPWYLYLQVGPAHSNTRPPLPPAACTTHQPPPWIAQKFQRTLSPWNRSSTSCRSPTLQCTAACLDPHSTDHCQNTKENYLNRRFRNRDVNCFFKLYFTEK